MQRMQCRWNLRYCHEGRERGKKPNVVKKKMRKREGERQTEGEGERMQNKQTMRLKLRRNFIYLYLFMYLRAITFVLLTLHLRIFRRMRRRGLRMKKYNSRIYKLESLILFPASLSPITRVVTVVLVVVADDRYSVSARSLITEFESDIIRPGLDFRLGRSKWKQ